MSGRSNATYICAPPDGGPCPRCDRLTELDYTGCRFCMKDVGGCGWSDQEPGPWRPRSTDPAPTIVPDTWITHDPGETTLHIVPRLPWHESTDLSPGDG